MAGPTYKKRIRSVEVCVWGTADDARMSIGKRYKDKTTGEYKDSKYLYPNELEALVECIHDCLTWVNNTKTPTPPTVQHEIMGVKLNVTPLADADIPW